MRMSDKRLEEIEANLGRLESGGILRQERNVPRELLGEVKRQRKVIAQATGKFKLSTPSNQSIYCDSTTDTVYIGESSDLPELAEELKQSSEGVK